jgi:hypothetical protein
MASVLTNRGKYDILEMSFRKAFGGGSLPTNLYVELITVAYVPVVDTNTESQCTEIAAGNGYTAGGYQLAMNATDFDVLTEDDTNDRALIQVKDVVWTASGGSIPGSGAGASYAILCDDNVTQGSRHVIASWDLVSARTVSDGQTLTLQDCELRLSTP